VDAHGMPVQFFITSGITADCPVAKQLSEGFQAEYLLADHGYDTDAIILKASEASIMPVIPPKKNRNNYVITTNIFINSAISLKMLSFFSKDGVVLLRVTRKTLLRLAPLFRFAASLSSSLFIDDTI